MNVYHIHLLAYQVTIMKRLNVQWDIKDHYVKVVIQTIVSLEDGHAACVLQTFKHI